ncbi:phosphate ABC transporter substrate-binding protein (PhoT family) [Novosphingobium kunmingense]|uniref:Phosphate ABC transporter substrate-binding protein (PhoT family) n=1 Tax=Novosphingobium kunmingense TaxID=1211806 RepID=A0A2N0I1W7_9SPHN|nr:substrate-binding domain-containing protein [Novosphingobium kunmingense]PKB25188.1 phosphate ABC transporter substrate-binding protein (PhoT family) [Novosphingobium kunmingense]
MTNKLLTFATVISASALLAACGGAQNSSRDQIRAVGSSTVYPFAKAVADSLAKSNTAIKSPIIESTGTGAGMKLFCSGVGVAFPDIENASRRMKKSEYEDCAKNGVDKIAEIQIGLDGVAFAEAKGGLGIKLTPEDVYKALAANPYGKPNTAKTWKDVNAALPAEPILVYGPPSTSGTRDALKELILTVGCNANAETKALKDSDKDKYEKICTEVRSDGAYVDAGENDNLIVQKLEANPKAIGIFGFSYLEENADKLMGLTMGGIEPTYATISDFSYPGARPLYIYVKVAHLDAIKGLREYVAEWAKSWSKDGLLAKQGMVVAPDAVLANSGRIASEFTLLDPAELK